MPFGLPKGAAGSGSRDAAGKKGERGGKKHGGLLYLMCWRTFVPNVLGRRTFVPNVLGRDPRPPLSHVKTTDRLSIAVTNTADANEIACIEIPWRRRIMTGIGRLPATIGFTKYSWNDMTAQSVNEGDQVHFQHFNSATLDQALAMHVSVDIDAKTSKASG
jgi:hypothetical protein